VRRDLAGGRREQTDIATALPTKGCAIRTFDALLLESLDETLTDLLGARIRKSIFEYLGCDMTREEIPHQPAKFFALLEEISGEKAANVIGRAANRKLCAKLGWEYHEIRGFTAADYFEEAKARLRREQKQSAVNAQEVINRW
jgi:hypothetical protein